MYSSVEFMVPLAGGLIMFFIVLSIIRGVLSLFWNSGSALKGAMSSQLLSFTLETVLSSITSAAYASAGLISALTTALIWVSFMLLMGSILYVTYEQAPWVWTDLARAYNAFVGPFVHATVVQVFKLTNEVFKGVIPLYNGLIFLIGRILQGFIFPTLTVEIHAVQQVGVSLYSLCRHLVLALFAWLQTVVVSCPDDNGDACFDLTDRTLDLVTPMADARDTVVHLFGITGRVCNPLRPITDILAYPLMDLNLAKGLHNIVNAVLYLVVQMPEVTHIRCKRHGSAGYLMCTPDLEPVFTFLVVGLRDLGRMLDNWLEVAFVVVQGVFGVSTSSCEGVQLTPPVLFPGALRSSLFGEGNQTVVVGLGGWLMAITDGSTVVYYGEGRMRAAAWHDKVSISHGVAAVSYSGTSPRDTTRLSAAVSSGSTALLGCSCVGRLQIQCSILPYEGLTEGQVSIVPVFFQQRSVESALACEDIDIVVQSVRWPATRFSSTSTPLPACSSTRTCNQVDATVWVVPRTKCDSESTLCACYPFCMAARLSGSQASPLVMYSAVQWRSKVYVVRRDCNLRMGSDEMDSDLTVEDDLGAVASTQTDGANAPRFVSGSTLSCSDNQLVTSIINRTVHPAYSTPSKAYLRRSAAPFVITGDTVLTTTKHGDGTYSVRIERLTGFSGSEFTLSEVTAHFPAYPPVNVPADLFSTYPRDHLTTPYARQSTLAVSSRNYVFYAVNPSMHVYDAYISYCKNSGASIDKFSLIMTSSFSPIRIWRVEAYRRCTAAGCGQDLVRQVDIPGAFSNGTATDGSDLSWDCLRSYNEGITQLEYINEANIAVTVRHTSVDATVLEYRTYWLNVHTMLLGQQPWVDEKASTALSAYTLCPSMQILPDLGSLSAEVLVAAVLLLKMPIDLVTYMPGIGQLWSTGMICPLQARGHSVLENCGSNAFSLDDFFNALEAATNNFWSSLSLLSLAVGTATPDNMASQFVQNFLNGLARYGAGSIDLWSLRFKVLDVMKTGPITVIQSLPTTVFASMQSGKWMEGLYKVTGNGLAWARFGYTCIVKIVVTIVQNALLNKPVSPERAWRIVVNTLDEMRGVYGATVEASVQQSCAGMALMFGLTNPWAVLLYNQCLAFKTMLSSGVDLMLAVFNVAPLTQCMCSGSGGKVFGDYAILNCVPQASTSMRPTLVQMVQSLRSGPALGSDAPLPTQLCQNMLAFTKKSMVNSVQPWFDAQFASMDALGSSLDFVLRWLDPKAGVCLNYDEDPDVVVIMPFPADYFQACASTSLCKAKCAAVWDAFDQSLTASPVKYSTQHVTVSAESLFFPSITLEAFNPMHVYAMTQPEQLTCNRVCGHEGDGCLAVAGVLRKLLVVQYYCVPKMMTSSVYRTVDAQLEWSVESSAAWVESLSQLRFADRDGHFLVALIGSSEVRMASSGSAVLLADKATLTEKLGIPVLTVLALQVMHSTPFSLASVHINLLYKLVDGRITAQPVHAKLVVKLSSFPDVALTWMSAGVSLFAGLDGYVVSQVESTAFTAASPSADFLLLPLTEGMPVSILTATWDAEFVELGVVRTTTHTLPEIPAGLAMLLDAGQVLSQNCVRDAEQAFVIFTAAPPRQSTTWLSQIRISGALAAAYHSQQVAVTVQTTTRCSVKSCAGCPDGEVQRLCDAVQRCSVINCIGTPVNMRRVLCQMGQTIADVSRQFLAIMHGGWTMFVDIFMVIMDLSLQKGLTGVRMTWPDDSFFGYICTAKDMSAHYISIFTSAINSVLQVGHTAVAFLQGGAHTIDSNFHAMATMPLTALTSFMHQVLLMPLYPLIVAQKVVMCRVQGVLAVFDAKGFKIAVGAADLQQASDALVGHCLTENHETQSANPADSSNSGMVEAMVQTAGVRRFMSALSFQGISLEPVVHAIDGAISYLMGVILGLYDLVASLDMAHCKMPDYFLNETVFCACGDSALGVAEVRKAEGVQQGAFWCTGTISLLDASNRPFIVYNPYTYAQLQEMAHQSDTYLSCVSSKQYSSGSGGCDRFLPSTPILQAQRVSVLTVLTACKSNYMNMQWDKAAYILFNQTVFEKEVAGANFPTFTSLPEPVSAARDCLQRLQQSPPCHDVFIRQDPKVFYSYQDIPKDSASQYVDACQVYTGPAQNTGIAPPTRSLFRACLDQYPDSDCKLSSNLWTPQSDNMVPVAHMHAVKLGRSGGLKAAVELKFQEAMESVMAALGPLQDYSNNALATIFFSPEGDIMHQMMDCVFMGPYSKVAYWPQDSQGLLPVPVWFRDADGSTRAVDPRACVKGSLDRSPPYSCGSAARQAVIKYFFRDYLPKQQNVTMTDIINSMVADIKQAWGNISTYACLCPDNSTHSLDCCAEPSGWLPASLHVQYQTVPPNIVLRRLTYELKQFYRYSLEDPEVWTKYMDPATLKAYDWSQNPASEAIAKQEAHFRTDAPVVGYNEVRSPFLTTALWQQCHGMLSQVFFTIPMVQAGAQWLPRNLPQDGIDGIRALDTYVRAAVREAFYHSPLYRHYNVSYVPSSSRLCRTPARTTAVPSGRVAVGGYAAAKTVLLEASSISFPAFGSNAFAMHSCFCGWPGEGPLCFPPSSVCPHISILCPSYTPSAAIDELLRAKWTPSWQCLAANLSDQWGLLNASEMDAWLTGDKQDFAIAGEALLRHGRAGLRLANLQGLAQQPFAPVAERRSVHPNDASLPYCESSFASMPSASEELRAMVERLFPVAQGVYESGATAYCLRYTIETAMLQALQLAFDTGLKSLGEALAAQRLVSDVWRRRCESQIALLALCKGLGVFQPPLKLSRRVYDCPFSVEVADSSDVYMTPGCLVHKNGIFYDPCNCAQATCGSTRPLFSSFTPSCQIAFDPRGVVSDTLGGWKISPVEGLDKTAFVRQVLSAKDGLGNTNKGGDWSRDEGFLNATGRHCDMIADWWPEEETLPVGYHATTTCSSDETGYRTFDSAFAVERVEKLGQYTVVRLVYQNDITRSAEHIDTFAGGGGVCRASNLGLPFVKSNRVRLCTRHQTGPDTLDVAIPPEQPLYSTLLPENTAYGDEVCSEESSDIGWFDIHGRQDSALHSVGTIPNMPSSSEATTYPEDSSHFFGVGPKADIQRDYNSGRTGWGEACSDFAVTECNGTTAVCPSGYFCLEEANICISDDFKAEIMSRCYRHDMCPPGLMCDGTGRCVPGSIVYLNTLYEPMEAAVFAEECDEVNSDTYLTDGASPWEYVPDWLQGHGMCSNKNWYMYSQDLASVTRCATSCSEKSCQFNARECMLAFNQSVWWPQLQAEPSRFAVKPTVCDRDYEHLRGPNGKPMVGCRPKNTVVSNTVSDWDGAKSALQYANLFRNYEDGVATRLALMPLRNLKKTGFLGFDEATLQSSTLINCENFQNCYTYKFTYNGVARARSFWQVRGVDLPYQDADTFRCGVIAYYDQASSKCKLDGRASHLYEALCKNTPLQQKCTCNQQAADSIGCSPTVSKARLDGICEYIQEEYTANYETIQANTRYLQDLFNVFEQSDGSLAAQVSGVECFSGIHESMQAARYGSDPAYGLYYPFTFALYEIPLAWVYQCGYMSALRVDPASTSITCANYENSKSKDELRQTKHFNFNLIRAGYTRQQILQRVNAFEAAIPASLPEIASLEEVKRKCAKMDNLNCLRVTMTPYCANRLDWIPRSSMDTETRKFLAAHYQLDCKTRLMEEILAAARKTYTEYVANHTVYKDYTVDSSVSKLKDIPSLITESLLSCVKERYNIHLYWPFAMTFPDQAKLGTCFRESLPAVLNSLSNHLIVSGSDYSDYNVAYMPSENIRDQRIPLPGKDPALDKCIFDSLNAQEKLVASKASAVDCAFADGSFVCGSVPCMTYPLTYMHGTQNCSYPLERAYTSLSALLIHVWEAMSEAFHESFSTVYSSLATSEAGLPPVELPFFPNSSHTSLLQWKFDTSDVRLFISNINPDIHREVMCVISKSNVNFTTCNNENFAALKAFTDSMRQKAAPIVPPNKQLEWRISREFLARGAVYGFAGAERSTDKVLLRNLFDERARCGANEQMYNRVCMLKNLTVRPWVPWMSGEWNPYEMCDVRRLDLNEGNQEEIWPFDHTACPKCSDVLGQYRTEYMYNSMSCAAKSSTYSKHVNVETSAPTNVCRIRLRDTDRQCNHPHGMLGGGRGRSVLNHPVVSHLYGTNNITGWPRQGGMYPRGDSILKGEDSAGEDRYGVFTVPGDELGVWRIGMAVESVPGVHMPFLRVARLPLSGSESGYMPSWETQDTANWTAGLHSAFLAEDAQHAKEQQRRINKAWDCSLRRAAYYSSALPKDTEFAPAVPSPGRAQRMFGSLTGGLSAHPTQTMHRDASGVGNYSTSNGFCFCPETMPSQQRQCLVQIADVSHPCSLAQTIRALQGEWTQSFVFNQQSPSGSDSTCQMQFDWPYVNGRLRDGVPIKGDYTLASNPMAEKCHVLDRVRPFQYRYRSDRPAIPAPGTSTTDPGGVCHTGRAAILTAQAKAVTTRCVKASENTTSVHISCEDGSTLVLAKEKSKPLDAMVEAVKKARMSCNTCSPPPTFTNSRGNPIQPESSFGIPFRFSASRMVAEDLKLMLGNASGLQMNESAWSNENFMRTLLTSPQSLFSLPVPPPMPESRVDSWPDGEWVFCNTTDALRAGQCKGSISESDWRRDRFQTCYRTTRELTQDSPEVMSSVDVCLLDSRLQDLCVAVDKAQTLVRQANCLASGSDTCALQPFVYQPSAWDVSNREFVHKTVSQFYTRITAAACPDHTQVLRANNLASMHRCAATPLGALYYALQGCRNIADALAKVLFYVISIAVNGLMLAFSTQREFVIAQIVYYWDCIVLEMRSLIEVLGNIIFKMLFSMGSLGVQIYSYLIRLCGLTNTAFGYWMDTWCTISVDLLPATLGAVRSLVESCETAFTVLDDALDSIFLSLGPAALSRMMEQGYDQTFRDKKSKLQAQERQAMSDTAKQSVKEGKKKKDGFQISGSLAVAGLGASTVTEAVLLYGLENAVKESPLGFVLDLASAINDWQEMKGLESLYPQNWTLFAFGKIYFALDFLEAFVSTDEMCLTHRSRNSTDIISCNFADLSSAAALDGNMLVATRCWADAQRSLGTSNLLACTEADTCYQSLFDRNTPIVCGSCPLAGSGYSTFGCSPLTKMCTCNVPTLQTTACSSNAECSYSTTTCQLVTSVDDMSYGNQPCTDCSKDVQCLVRGGSSEGGCACLFQAQPLQRCTQMPGQRVYLTDPSRMCGYLPNADHSMPLTTAQWDELSLVQCIYLNPAFVYCAQVYQRGVPAPLAVGLQMASVSFRSRRLLAEGQFSQFSQFSQFKAKEPESEQTHRLLMEDWNSTSEPCHSLVIGYQQAVKANESVRYGPTDTEKLHSCAYWVYVGRRTIEHYNLTALRGADSFLLSPDDFAAALMRRWVLVQLLQKPSALLFALGHWPAFRPLYAAMMVVRTASMSWGMRSLGEVRYRRWNLTNHTPASPLPEDEESVEEIIDSVISTTEDLIDSIDPPSKQPGRKLLQSQTDIKFAETWLAGPFTWPPPFVTKLQSAKCSAATAMLQIFHEVTAVLARYYSGSYTPTRRVSKRIVDNLPNLTCSSNLQPVPAAADSWIASTYHTVWSVAGVNPGYVREFFSDESTTNLFTITTTMLKCDFQAVTFCSAHRKDLFASIIILLLFIFIVGYFGQLVAIPYISVVLVLSFVPLLMWYAYGMAFTCTPMLPTCLMSDVVELVESIFPLQVTFPAALQTSPDCLADPTKSSCMLRCSEPPVSFVDWRDTLAFGICYSSQLLCASLAGVIGESDSLGSKLTARNAMLDSGDENLISANLFCFGVTFVNIIPVVMLMLVAVTMAGYVFYMPCVLLPKLFALLAQALLYLHTQ